MIKIKIIFIIIIIVSICEGEVIIGDNPIVKLDDGMLSGTYERTPKNIPYAAFLGIRYTEPMIGDMRFMAPVKISSWVGIRHATEECPVCVQPSGNTTIGSELCTCLNVFTPLNTTTSKCGLSVIVYFHGGAFYAGGASFNQYLFTDKNIIFVGVQYRLGVLGFLSLHTREVPGNAGMKDQVMALEWVRSNIRKFGGNPNKVTIFGLSAGAGSVSLIQLSKMATGLFRRVIPVSGSALSGWATQPDPVDKATKLGVLLGFNSSSPSFVKDLQNLTADIIVSAGVKVLPSIPGNIQEETWNPVVEKHCNIRSDCFLDDIPLNIIRSGQYNQAETLINCNSMEYLSLYYFTENRNTSLQTLTNTPKTIVPITWQKTLSEETIIEVHKIILDRYFGGQPFNILDREHFKSAIDLIGDVMFYVPIVAYAHELANTSRRSIYFEEFSVMGLGAKYFTPFGLTGSSHAFENMYLNPMEDPIVDEYSPDGTTRRNLVEIYENFIHEGNPMSHRWLPFTKDTSNYLSIDRALVPSINPNDVRINFWKQLEEKVFSGAFA